MNADIVIVGGGIAGLWILNLLCQKGYNAILLEKEALGGVQTLASQGMIHGGQKYTLTGQISDQAINVAEMPTVWQSCFDGEGMIDLSSVKALSNHQVMWASGGMTSNLGVFAASKAVNAKTEKLSQDLLPTVLQGMKCQAYKMAESVLDIKSLIKVLAAPYREHIYQADYFECEIEAQGVIFTAGTGNERAVDQNQQTQRRPLKQVMVKTMEFPLYGHCIAAHPKPRVTITAHPFEEGYVWYLGGNISELSVKKTDEEAIDFARSELEDIFPQMNWSGKKWATWSGNRAEPYAPKGLPTGSYFKIYEDKIVAWPTKLTFAPVLAGQLLDWVQEKNIRPVVESHQLDLPLAEIGCYPWEKAQWF